MNIICNFHFFNNDQSVGTIEKILKFCRVVGGGSWILRLILGEGTCLRWKDIGGNIFQTI